MPRANRVSVPNQVWHLTHRCHEKRFLLKFARDRRRWTTLLFEATRRFDLRVLDYTVTCNHIHLLVLDRGNKEIPRSMQWIAGRTGQEYNRRRGRCGAFWEDRYHATAVDSGEHLARCLVYIDLNMVRAGAVSHPGEWPHGGYHELQGTRARYRSVDRESLGMSLGFDNPAALALAHRSWVEEALRNGPAAREPQWTQSVAVGSPPFVNDIRKQLGLEGRRRIAPWGEGCQVLREPPIAYNPLLGAENETLRA